MKINFREYEIEIKAKSKYSGKARSNKHDTFNLINEVICDFITLERYLKNDTNEAYRNCAELIREDIDELNNIEGFKEWRHSLLEIIEKQSK